MKVRILNSIASVEGWSFSGGEVVDETHPHFEAARRLCAGDNAEFIEDATARPAAERAVSPRGRRVTE